MASKNSTYIMVTSEGKYIGQGFFTPETARQYAVTYMRQNGVGITYAKVEGTIPFIPDLDDIDEADAMFNQHQAMKAAMNR
jgi:hypothetical protein